MDYQSMNRGGRRRFLRWLGLAASGGAAVACSSTRGGILRPDELADAGEDDPQALSGSGAGAGPDDDAAVYAGELPARYSTQPPETPGSGQYQAAHCDPTSPDVLGPFFLEGAPSRAQIADEDEPGERLVISGTVRDAACRPVALALLDVWQADSEGNYHDADSDYRLRGQLLTDADGRYEFFTVRPGNYALSNGLRPAHVHLSAHAPGFASLTTQIYFAGDPHLGHADACGTGCNSGASDLIIALEGRPLRGSFDIVLARG